MGISFSDRYPVDVAIGSEMLVKKKFGWLSDPSNWVASEPSNWFPKLSPSVPDYSWMVYLFIYLFIYPFIYLFTHFFIYYIDILITCAVGVANFIYNIIMSSIANAKIN